MQFVVAAQSADINTMSRKLSAAKKTAEAAARVLEEVMNKGSDLSESYKLAHSEITLGEVCCWCNVL